MWFYNKFFRANEKNMTELADTKLGLAKRFWKSNSNIKFVFLFRDKSVADEQAAHPEADRLYQCDRHTKALLL